MSLEVVKAVLTGTPRMWDTERATALTDWQGEFEGRLGRPGGQGVDMENRADGRLGRPNDKEINKTNESRTTTNSKDQITRQITTRIKKTKHQAQEDDNQSKNKNQRHNPHPAWNPDSRWSA